MGGNRTRPSSAVAGLCEPGQGVTTPTPGRGGEGGEGRGEGRGVVLYDACCTAMHCAVHRTTPCVPCYTTLCCAVHCSV